MTESKTIMLTRALTSKRFLPILNLLRRNEELSVTQIYCKLNLEQPQLSASLAELRGFRFVLTRKEGKNVYYKIDVNRINEVKKNFLEI